MRFSYYLDAPRDEPAPPDELIAELADRLRQSEDWSLFMDSSREPGGAPFYVGLSVYGSAELPSDFDQARQQVGQVVRALIAKVDSAGGVKIAGERFHRYI